MKDNFGRDINYMRISVTDRCNLRCKYCMPEAGIENLGHEHILKFEDIERIVRAATELGIEKYRITGGEPLVRKGIVGLVESLSAIPGVETLTMTSNGLLLPKYAESLKKAGLDRMNISLDTLNHTKYHDITRGGDLDQAIAGINAAVKAGLTPIKLNVVAMKGFNDDEIMDFVQLTYQYDYEVRFIELMPIGNADTGRGYELITNEEIKKKLPALKSLESTDGVAEIFKYPGARGTLGFISPMSCQFCDHCNKIRLTADGKIKTCLHSNQEVDLMPILKQNDDELLKETLKNAILAKEDRHYLNEGAA
ncbi:MAG: GTP 3',8-cyclase MoaA, partial [Anaerovorax sp.]